jgi:mRNA-degrading endonuclease toxin of MazEF toxin-antitoxin module
MSKKLLFPRGFPRLGEIYLVDFNRKREKEIFKIRPALVVSSNLQNKYDKQILMAPISAEEELTEEEIKLLAVLAVPISPSHQTGLNKESRILLHRVRAVYKGKPRLLEYLGERPVQK